MTHSTSNISPLVLNKLLLISGLYYSKSKKLPFLFKSISFLAVITHLSLFIYGISLKLTICYDGLKDTIIILDGALYVMMVASNIVGVIRYRTTTNKTFNRYFTTLKLIHNKFGDHVYSRHNWVVLAYHILYTIYFISTVINGNADRNFDVKCNLLTNINTYFVGLTFLEYYIFCDYILESFQHINKLFLKKIEEVQHMNEKLHFSLSGEKLFFQALLRSYNGAYDLIDYLDEALGMEIFVVTTLIFLTCIHSINSFVKMFVESEVKEIIHISFVLVWRAGLFLVGKRLLKNVFLISC